MELDGKLHLFLYGPEIIHRESEPVTPEEFGEIPKLMEYMIKVMRKCGSNGLSAPQVGWFKNFLIYEKKNSNVVGLINPSVERMIGKELNVQETCLSLPPVGNSCMTPRMEIVFVRASTVERPSVEQHLKLTGRDSLIVQREMDHLTGTFFIDRVPPTRKNEVLKKFNDWQQKWEAAGRPFPY
jgi:peptide deformylase